MGKDTKESEADLKEKVESLELEVDQLKHAVEYYKKKGEEESPVAVHAELHRLRRACRVALDIALAPEGLKRVPRPLKNKYARVARAMGRSATGGGASRESIAQCLTNALNDAPHSRIEIPRVKAEEKDQ